MELISCSDETATVQYTEGDLEGQLTVFPDEKFTKIVFASSVIQVLNGCFHVSPERNKWKSTTGIRAHVSRR